MKRMYSVFMKEGKNWTRLSNFSYPLATARRIYQDMLLSGSIVGLNMSLRVVTSDPPYNTKEMEDARDRFISKL